MKPNKQLNGKTPSPFPKWGGLLVLFLIIGVAGYFFRDEIASFFGEKPDPRFSMDQQKVIDAFGKPQAFTLVSPVGEPRLETWQYPLLDTVLTFSDGAFVSRTHVPFGITKDANLMYAAMTPADFYEISSLAQMEQQVGVPPSASSEIHPDLLDNATIHNFGNLISVGVMNEQVVFVKTMVYEDSGQALSPTDAARTTNINKDGTDDTAWMTGRVFAMDDSFSVFVDRDYQNLIYATVEFEGETRRHVFCFRGEENSEESACEGVGVPIFSITEYTLDQYREIQKSELADMYVKIGESGNTVYIFSHPNGDVPQELQNGKVIEIYDLVRESFMIGAPSP